MKENYELPQQIIDAYNNKNLVIFIGAGISRLMGCKGWDKLSNDLIEKIYNFADASQILASDLSPKEKITIAFYKAEKDNRLDDFYNKMRESFIPNPDSVDIYQYIVKFNCIFVTTNADGLLEKHCMSHKSTTICKAENLAANGYPYLYYAHGRLGNGDSEDLKTLIFTTKDYLKKYNDNEYINFLKRIFNDYTVLFLGYGLNEFELLDHIISKGKSNINNTNYINHYILEGFCSQHEALIEAKKSYYKSLGIGLLTYCQDEDGYNRQYDIISNWVTQINSCTYNSSDTINELKMIAKTFDNNKLELKRICTELDPDNKIFLKYFLNNLKSSNYYFEYLSFLWKEKIVSIQDIPSINKTNNEFTSPYWGFLQCLVEILSINRNDTKLQQLSCNIVKESIKHIINDCDLFSNFNVKRNIIDVVLLLNEKIIDTDLIDSILSFDEDGFNMDVIGSQICKSDYSWLNWEKSIVTQVLSYVFTLKNENDSVRSNVQDFNFEEIYHKIKDRITPSIKKEITLHIINTIFQAIDTDDYYYGESFDTQFIYHNEVVSSMHKILTDLLKNFQISNSEMIKLAEKSRTKITVQFILNLCLLNNCNISILKEFEKNPLSLYGVSCDYYRFLESKKELNSAETEIIKEQLQNAEFDFDPNNENDQKYIITCKLELLSKLKDKSEEFQALYDNLINHAHYTITDFEENALRRIPTVSFYNPLDDLDKSLILNKTLKKSFDIISDKKNVSQIFYIREQFEYIIDQYLVKNKIDDIFSLVDEHFEEKYRYVIISILTHEKYIKYYIFDSTLKIIESIIKKTSLKPDNEIEVIFRKNIITLLEYFFQKLKDKKVIFELCLLIDKLLFFQTKTTECTYLSESETYLCMINDGETKLYMLMFNIIASLKNTKDFEYLFNEFKNITTKKIKCNNPAFLNALYFNMQQCIYINKDWANHIFQNQPDATNLSKLLGLACMGSNYIIDILLNAMVKNIKSIFSNQNIDKQLNNIMIQFLVSSYMFEKINEATYSNVLETINESNYYVVFNAIVNQKSNDIKISKSDTFKTTFDIIKNKINEYKTYVKIISNAKSLPEFDNEIWHIITDCLNELKDKVPWFNSEDIFKNGACDSEDFINCLLVYIKSFSIRNFDIFKSIIDELIKINKKDKAIELCNTLIYRGVFIEESRNIINKIKKTR